MDRRKVIKIIIFVSSLTGITYLLGREEILNYLFPSNNVRDNSTKPDLEEEPANDIDEVTQDIRPLSIEILDLSLSSFSIEELEISLKVRVSDPSRVESISVTYTLNDVSVSGKPVLEDDVFVDEVTLPFNGEITGRVVARVVVIDESGSQYIKTIEDSILNLVNRYDVLSPRIIDVMLSLDKPDILNIEASVQDDTVVSDVIGDLNLGGQSLPITLRKTDSKYIAQETIPIDDYLITLTLTARDVTGKESSQTITQAYVDLLRQIDRQIPSITYTINYIATDTADYIDITYTADDNIKLKNKEIIINGKPTTNPTIQIDINKTTQLKIEFKAEDLAGNTASETITLTQKQLIQKLFQNHLQTKNPELANKLSQEQLNTLTNTETIQQIFKDYTLRSQLTTTYNYINKDPEQTIYTITRLDQTLKQYIQNKKQIYLKTIQHLNQNNILNPTNTILKAITQYYNATTQQNLRENPEALNTLIQNIQSLETGDDYAKQQAQKLIEWQEITFKSVDGNHVTIKPAIENTYLLTEFLHKLKQENINLADHPELCEAINTKIFANQWSIFQATYGIAYYEAKKNNPIKPDTPEILDLIHEQWQHMKQFTPQFGDNTLLYNRQFPWYNQKQLAQLYPNQETRKQALFLLFLIPPATYDLQNEQIITGIEAAKKAWQQAQQIHQQITELYPDGTVNHQIWGTVDIRFYYYDWIVDRCTPLSNPPRLVETGKQYVGIYADQLWDIITQNPTNFLPIIMQYDGIDQHLSKHQQYGQTWDLIKFITGYIRWLPEAIEWHGINYISPQTLQYFGFPTNHTNIHPNPPGTSGYEWAISLPQYMADELKNKYGNDIVIGHGNTFGLYNTKKGLIQDGVKEIAFKVGNRSPMSDFYLYSEILAYLYKEG